MAGGFSWREALLSFSVVLYIAYVVHVLQGFRSLGKGNYEVAMLYHV